MRIILSSSLILSLSILCCSVLAINNLENVNNQDKLLFPLPTGDISPINGPVVSTATVPSVPGVPGIPSEEAPTNPPSFVTPSQTPAPVVVVSSTITQSNTDAATTLKPTSTIISYVTGVESSCERILLDLRNIGFYSILSIIVSWFI